MPAADARLTNPNYPTPETLGEFSVTDLLTAAAYGRLGIDKRLIKTILERGDAAIPDLTRFAMEPFADEHDTANLTRSLFLLLRHYKTPQAMPFLIELLYANIEELPEELMEAVLEVGEPAVAPVIEMFDKIDDEEQRGEIAFLLASFRNRDPRILERLVDHFEYDAGDGIIILDSFGDPGAIPAIQKIAEEPGLDAELQKELLGVIERLREDAPLDDDEKPPYDVLAEFPDTARPVFDLLTDYELMHMLESPSEEFRASAVENLVPQELTPKVTERVHALARTDPSGALRGRAWEALARDPDDKALVAELVTVLEDTSKPAEERSGALVALASLDKYSRLKEAILDFYHAFPQERARVIKAMWRSLDRAWAKYVVEGLSHDDEVVQEQAILGIGNLSLASEADKLEALFDHDSLRPAALYAYALAAPGETTRARMKSLFNRIEKLANELDEEEAELVESALDERLASRGLKPVFNVEEPGGGGGHEHHHHAGDDHDLAHHDHGPKAVEGPPKVGRNDPCPCGSGKKYKKCHGQ